jgi:hypothetical protein
VTTNRSVLAVSTALMVADAMLSVPAAHASDLCTVNGPQLALVNASDHYYEVDIDADGFILGPSASAYHGGTRRYGQVSGMGISGRVIDFTMEWLRNDQVPPMGVPHKPAHFTGRIGNDGYASGDVPGEGFDGFVLGPWVSTTRFQCTLTSRPLPGHNSHGNPAPAAAGATITGDVDIYKSPGGGGKPYDMVRSGTKVTVDTRQSDNWVKISGDGVPGGSGWVWGDFVSS